VVIATKARAAAPACRRCSLPPRTSGLGARRIRGAHHRRALLRRHRGACIGHVSPEAAEGGLIGLLKDGDRIRIDIPGRTLEALLDVAEIARRRAAAPAWKPRDLGGWLRRYSLSVGNASSGASLM
jgi:hypothetical protein